MDNRPPGSKTPMLASLGQLLGRQRFMQKLGLSYGSRRDTYVVAGYPKELEFAHLFGIYMRGDIAGRIVDMQPQTTWRTPPVVTDHPDDPELETTFTTAWNDLAERFHLWSRFERIDRLSGIGSYGVLFLGTAGVEDAALRTPLDRLAPQDLLYIQPYHQGDAVIKTWVTDTRDPRFGQPETYGIQIGADIPGFGRGGEIVVHASRVIHIAEDRLSNEVFGRPRLERIYNRLMDVDKVAAATGESYWQLAARVLQAKVDPEAELPPGDRQEVLDQMEEIAHDLRRVFMGQAIDLNWLSSDTPKPQEVADFYFSLIAAAVGIPKRILFGSETGERASEQDQRHYLGTINERQEKHAEPFILRLTINRFILLGTLPKPAKGKYTVSWPALWEESDGEKATTSLTRAQAAKTLTPVGDDPRKLVVVTTEGDIELKPFDGKDIGPIEAIDPLPNLPPGFGGPMDGLPPNPGQRPGRPGADPGTPSPGPDAAVGGDVNADGGNA